MKTADKWEGSSWWCGPARFFGDSGYLAGPSLDTSRISGAWKGAYGSSLCKDQVGSTGAPKRALGEGIGASLRHAAASRIVPGRDRGHVLRARGRGEPAFGWMTARPAGGLRGQAIVRWGHWLALVALTACAACVSSAAPDVTLIPVDDSLVQPSVPTLSVEEAALSDARDGGVEHVAALRDVPWTTLFDGRSLDGWQAGVFGDSDDPEFTEGGVVLPIGVPLSGITYLGEPPSGRYALEVQATRKYGSDFFLGITFPVRDEHVTLVLGGWGGVVCGLSCIDGEDASSNSTRTYAEFPNGKRQTVLIEVDDQRVRAWVEGTPLIDAALEGRRLGVRPEVQPSLPLGVASFITCTELHSVRVWLRGESPEAQPPAPASSLAPIPGQ
ncbi:MAG: hypothetical protein ACI8WY_000806 [Planctomycetota bacterium]|jgi:hypothetical protein